MLDNKPANHGGDDGETEPWQDNASTRDPPLPEPPIIASVGGVCGQFQTVMKKAKEVEE